MKNRDELVTLTKTEEVECSWRNDNSNNKEWYYYLTDTTTGQQYKINMFRYTNVAWRSTIKTEKICIGWNNEAYHYATYGGDLFDKFGVHFQPDQKDSAELKLIQLAKRWILMSKEEKLALYNLPAKY